MQNPMNILAIIPARGASKGIPRKNLKLLNDKPLINHTIQAALICYKIYRFDRRQGDYENFKIFECRSVKKTKRIG